MALLEQRISRSGWNEMSELGWWDLVGLGLPSQLAELAIGMSGRAGRRLRAYVMPTLGAGVAGLAIPFIEEDAVVFDSLLLGRADELADVIAHELAYMLYPGWRDLGLEEYREMERFAWALAPMMLDELPTEIAAVDPMVELTLCNQLAA